MCSRRGEDFAARELRVLQGTARWLVGPNPPIELWEGPLGSPWHVPPGTMRLDHLGYWGVDMEAQAVQLEALGYGLEWTPVVNAHDLATDGPYRGFAYFKNAHGDRVEIQRAGDKPAMAKWLAGGEMEPNYPTRKNGGDIRLPGLPPSRTCHDRANHRNGAASENGKNRTLSWRGSVLTSHHRGVVITVFR